MMALAEIVRLTGAGACVECGKCSASCSMAEMYPDFSGNSSPRGLVQHTLRRAMGLEEKTDPALLRRCLQCGNCTESCPEGVDCARLIALLREEARRAGESGFRFCSECGREIAAEPVRQWLDATLGPEKKADGDPPLPGRLQKFLDAPEAVDAPQPAYLTLCPVCRRQAYAAGNG